MAQQTRQRPPDAADIVALPRLLEAIQDPRVPGQNFQANLCRTSSETKARTARLIIAAIDGELALAQRPRDD